MNNPEFRLFFDYVDPASFLLEEVVSDAVAHAESRVFRHPLELRPPPLSLVDPDDDRWLALQAELAPAARERGLALTTPALVPRTRKAHELALHARDKGRFPEAHLRLFRAHHLEGLDLGRVDVLVGLAEELGLDRTEAKAVLDVDRHTGALVELRQEAERLGVRRVPTLLAVHGRLEGFHDVEAVRSFAERRP